MKPPAEAELATPQSDISTISEQLWATDKQPRNEDDAKQEKDSPPHCHVS